MAHPVKISTNINRMTNSATTAGVDYIATASFRRLSEFMKKMPMEVMTTGAPNHALCSRHLPALTLTTEKNMA